MTHKQYIEEKVRRIIAMLSERVNGSLDGVPYKAKLVDSGWYEYFLTLTFGDGISIRISIEVEEMPELQDIEVTRVVPKDAAFLFEALWPDLAISKEAS